MAQYALDDYAVQRHCVSRDAVVEVEQGPDLALLVAGCHEEPLGEPT